MAVASLACDGVAMAVCAKNPYPDQAAARLALKSILSKNRAKAAKMPKRVYPCDSCDGWHLTAKPLSGKTPPWERDPNWVRPPLNRSS
jgi:hypothetical protein